MQRYISKYGYNFRSSLLIRFFPVPLDVGEEERTRGMGAGERTSALSFYSVKMHLPERVLIDVIMQPDAFDNASKNMDKNCARRGGTKARQEPGLGIRLKYRACHYSPFDRALCPASAIDVSTV
jgi:hypothetical protein